MRIGVSISPTVPPLQPWLTSAPAIPLDVAAQTVTVGRLTLEGAGAAPVVATTGTIAAASISVDDPTNPGHWAITADGALSPTAAGAGALAASYALTCDFASSAGSLSGVSITIATVAGEYDVASQDELDAALAVAALGTDVIRFRHAPQTVDFVTWGGQSNAAAIQDDFDTLRRAQSPDQIFLHSTSAVADTGFMDTGDSWHGPTTSVQAPGVGDSLYLAWRDAANALLTTVPDAVLSAFCWHQGEENTASADYALWLDGLISDLRTEVTGADATTPFVVGGMVPERLSTTTTSIALPQRVIEQTPGRVLYAGYASSVGMAAINDATTGDYATHFDTASQATMAERYLDQIPVAAARSALADQVPALAASTPASGATGVSDATTAITLTFAEDMQFGLGPLTVQTAAGAVLESFESAAPSAPTDPILSLAGSAGGTASISGAVCTITLGAALSAGTDYQVLWRGDALYSLEGVSADPSGFDGFAEISWATEAAASTEPTIVFEALAEARFDNLSGGYWQRVFDYGNGAPMDNILLSQSGASATMVFEVYYAETSMSTVSAVDAIVEGEVATWRVVVDDTGWTTLYKDGVEIASGAGAIPETLTRTSKLVGESNWPSDTALIGEVLSIQVNETGPLSALTTV